MMNKVSIMLVLLTMVCASYAQREYYIGMHGGITVPAILNQNAWGAEEYEYEFMPKSEIGIELSVINNLDFQLMLGFGRTTMGQAYTSNYEGHDWKRKLKLDYFLIPLTMRKTLYDGNNIDWLGSVGLIWAIRQNATQSWTKNGTNISQQQDYQLWRKPYWISDQEVDERFVRHDYMAYFDLGCRKFISSVFYIDITAYAAVGLRDINHPKWRIKNKLKKEYGASHNAFGGVKIALGYKIAQVGRFKLINN